MNPTFDRDSLLPWREGINVVAVVLLFGGDHGRCASGSHEPSEGITFLYVVPITLLTLQYGWNGRDRRARGWRSRCS